MNQELDTLMGSEMFCLCVDELRHDSSLRLSHVCNAEKIMIETTSTIFCLSDSAVEPVCATSVNLFS